MDYSDIRNDSNYLDQVLLIIFVILIIFVVFYFFNSNKCIDEKFKDKINYSNMNTNELLQQLEKDNTFENDCNNYEEIKRNHQISHQQEHKEKEHEPDSEIAKFLRRINNKYNHVKTEDTRESFNSLNDDNVNQEMDMNMYVNMNMDKVNRLSEPENISGFLNGDMACNMDQQQKELVNSYKKKYFKMYRHQIECPKNCQLSNLSRCNLADNNDCEGILTKDYNNPDVLTLAHLALKNNNKRECVTCTSMDDRQTSNMNIINSNVNEEDEVKINERRLNNRNKFADFNDYIDRNGVLETSVDKIAELRTSTTGTCGLSSFGKKVSDVYDNLLSTTYTEEKNQCVQGPVEGINDSNSNDSYARV